MLFILMTMIPSRGPHDLVDLHRLDPSIVLDIRYARDDNFLGRAVYPSPRAFLQRPAAEALARVHRRLGKQGLGLVVYDGYRPWSVTRVFWETVKPEDRKFVADPARGSKHNRGCAVDLSLVELSTGRPLPMPSGFDEFTERAASDYSGGTAEETRNRGILRSAMEAEGWIGIRWEWWHYDFRGWENYPVLDLAFEEIDDDHRARGNLHI